MYFPCIYLSLSLHYAAGVQVCCQHRDLQKPSLRCIELRLCRQRRWAIFLLWHELHLFQRKCSLDSKSVDSLLLALWFAETIVAVHGLLQWGPHWCQKPSLFRVAYSVGAKLVTIWLKIQMNMGSYLLFCVAHSVGAMSVCTVVQLDVSSMICRNHRCDADPVTAAKKSQETIPLFTFHIFCCCARALFSFLHLNYFGALQIQWQLLKTHACQERTPILWHTHSIPIKNAKQHSVIAAIALCCYPSVKMNMRNSCKIPTTIPQLTLY